MNRETHYPSYDVMKEKDHWDEHTRSIVDSRLEAGEAGKFLTRREEELLSKICARLAGDEREDRIRFVVSHIDQTLHSPVGEGQRKPGVPDGKALLRNGLKALDRTAKKTAGHPFDELDGSAQDSLIIQVSRGAAPDPPAWDGLPQQAFFKKLLTMTLEAYYSHPDVWSEIGYGGPAYPRGYVRTQLGQLDPWEAQPEDE